jgi:hypothetical protein
LENTFYLGYYIMCSSEREGYNDPKSAFKDQSVSINIVQ